MELNTFTHMVTGEETFIPAMVFIPNTNQRLSVMYCEELKAVVCINGGLFLPADTEAACNGGVAGTLQLASAYEVGQKEDTKKTIKLGSCEPGTATEFGTVSKSTNTKQFNAIVLYNSITGSIHSAYDDEEKANSAFDKIWSLTQFPSMRLKKLTYWSDIGKAHQYLEGVSVDSCCA
ncbi:hypothetical protein HJ202_18615 [Vibrio parahaemolyticus]|uniref:hypothetical protein n=1 Tax=Vibrio harveyi group TaxID=717610 RepID=UPI000A39D0CA|nr:hypothetical protein [Vibrio parahaemolyticus]MBE3722341.1 hypothetical protein [Vibrio parahaemolyticus]MBE4244954.1 hypothetical protein [Vibrio parahaemolyticus]MBO0175175.1 hypothetical protein [Vibrio parahaemolyticus]HCE3682896.1 hypothetical protein [Vibrio parahaemolyticus]HCE4562568.1 hypothetical protein [Vibrio parahaemolyticus]